MFTRKNTTIITAMALLSLSSLQADDIGHRHVIVGSGIKMDELKIVTNTDRLSFQQDGDGILVTVVPGKKCTPTIFLAPKEGVWDFSKFGHIEAVIKNSDMDNPLRMELRVDNEGHWRDKPWNCEVQRILPGKTMPVKVIFGHQYGQNPGYDLDPSSITKVALFFEHPEHTRSYKIESLVAAGPAGERPFVDPRSHRHDLPDGFLIGGGGAKLYLSKQMRSTPNITAETSMHNGQQTLDLELKTGNPESRIILAPPTGGWNFSRSTNVRFDFTNTGKVPVQPFVWMASNDSDEITDKHSTDKPIAPGESATIMLSYIPGEVWEGPRVIEGRYIRGTKGTRFKSDTVKRVILEFDHADAAHIRVDSIRAVVITEHLPEWVGTRPPIPGDWVMTLDENFEGEKLNDEIWENIAPNWWGEKHVTYNSRTNVFLRDGHAVLRVEKRPGWQADDPESGHRGQYALGVLRTYGKWTQLYGYFESRMKIPRKTALWPAFWLMPDRGEEAGEQWRRQNIADGGMEFDIMEHLTRWGSYRYTIAMHWDGYTDNHKATGAGVYFNPSPDGYITAGCLWLPGFVAYYVNGSEVARWEHERISHITSEILFTMPLGGWDNDKRPIDSELPADFIIDYVRVWQRKDFIK